MKDVHPAIWGGDAWRFLHTLANSYPDDPDTTTRRGMFDLIKALMVVLPCSQCRKHLTNFMGSSGLRSSESQAMLTGPAFRAWMDQAHINANNQRDQKPRPPPPMVAANNQRDQKPRPPPPMVAVAAGASVVMRQPPPVGTLDSMFATDAITRVDEQRQRGLAISFYIITPVLLGMFVAFVVVTWRRR